VALRRPQSRCRDTAQTSRGKIDRLHRALAGFTTPTLDDMDFAINCLLVRPGRPRYPVLVHRAAALLHASSRRHLTTTPLRFANPSPSSGWIEDFHLQAVDQCSAHNNKGHLSSGPLGWIYLILICLLQRRDETSGRALWLGLAQTERLKGYPEGVPL